jgi:hypothetical protein
LFQFDRSRRRVLAAGAASVAVAGCQTVRPARELVTVNLADAPPLPPPDNTTTQLETAFDQASRMSVPVFLNGAGPYQFVVDTGANRSVVAQELAATLSLDSLGPAAVHGIAGVEPAPLYRVRTLRVGGVFSTNLQLPGAPVARLGADGLVGVDVLRDRRVTLGFARNEFLISPSVLRGAMGRGGGTRLPPLGDRSVTVIARYRFGQLIIVDAEVAGIPVTAFLDSGSQITVGNEALRRAILKAQPGLADRFVDAPLVSATGQVAHGQFTALPPLRLGGLLVQQLSAVFADLHIFDLWGLLQQPALLIGVDVLRRFDSVVLDFGRREVTFTPPRLVRNRASSAGSAAPGP